MKVLVMSLLLMGHLVMGDLLGGRPAAAVTLDFETLDDMELVTTQFAGVTFGNTLALVSGAEGGTLNELDFPPHSGATVVIDLFGAITIAFAAPVAAASGFFTYAAPVTITAFDALLGPVATATSDFDTNTVVQGEPGSAPNELIEIAFAAGISSLTVQGAPNGLSFTLDDFTFIPRIPLVAAEPPVAALVVLVAGTVLALADWRRRRTGSRRRTPVAY
jgi:hypothetical protein